MAKSNMDVDGFKRAQAEAAAADGVRLRPSPFPSFRAPTSQNLGASQANATLASAEQDITAPVVATATEVPAAVTATPPQVQSDAAPEDANAVPATSVADAEFDVDLDLLDPLPTNSRFDYSDEEVDELLGKLIQEGRQLKPMELTPNDKVPGRYFVLDGMTRKLSLKKWGKTKGRAVLVTVNDPWERYKASWYANNGSRHTTDYDNGMRWRAMIDEGIVTQPQISVTLGEKFSTPTVSRILSITKLPADCRAYIRDHKLKLSSGFYYLVNGLMNELKGEERMVEQLLDMLKMAVEEDLSVRVFEDRINKVIEGREAKVPAANAAASQKALPPRPLLFSGREVGAIKEWPASDRLEISMKKVPTEVRDRIKEAIQKVLEQATQGSEASAG